ncbi:MAG: PQ-loop domain-containing transporter [Thermoplasmatota archaeon]
MDGWHALIDLGSAGFVLCLMPQLVRTLRRGRADDLSLGFLVLVIASSAATLPYMIHIGEDVFAGAQAANLIVWGTALYFRLRPRGQP